MDEESRQIRQNVVELRASLAKTVEFNEILQKENEKYRALTKKFKIEV